MKQIGPCVTTLATWRQCALIDAIINDIDIGIFYTKPGPAKVTLQLHVIHVALKFNGNFNYSSALGKLNYVG